MSWNVKVEPEPENPSGDGKNEGGLVVYVTDGYERHEVSRVLFVRKHSPNKRVPFSKQLRQVRATAADAARALNDAEAAEGDEVEAARAQITHAADSAEAAARRLRAAQERIRVAGADIVAREPDKS